MNELRDLINHYRIRSVIMENLTNWLRLCSSMDVIEDTQLAIESFQYDKLGDELIDGIGYLQIYGLMQSLFLQQDALQNIALAINHKYDLSPELRKIRELRNDTVGHPTDRNRGQYFCFIVRSSIHGRKFTYYRDRPEGDRFNQVDVDIGHLINTQYSEIESGINQIIDHIKKEENKHRELHMGEKMIEVFPPVLNWYFSKLNEAIGNPQLFKLGALHVREIKKVLTELEAALKKRDELEASDWFHERVNDVDYPLTQLAHYFSSSSECEINGITASIFVFYVRKMYDEIKSVVKEIDEEYESSL